MHTTPINTQPVEKRKTSDGTILQLHSIFDTIQGEGPFTGHPAVFVRLAGCNLQCPSCDTDYTSDRRDTTHIRTIIETVQGLRPMGWLVVITGGEPFRQNIGPLVSSLVQSGYKVQIETNGTLPPQDYLEESIPWDDENVTIVCSPKAGKIHPLIANIVDAYKYVLSHDSVDPEDGLPILALNHTAAPKVARPAMWYKSIPIYLQPMDPKNDAEYMLNVKAVKESCMKFGYVLQLQVHKLINVE